MTKVKTIQVEKTKIRTAINRYASALQQTRLLKQQMAELKEIIMPELADDQNYSVGNYKIRKSKKIRPYILITQFRELNKSLQKMLYVKEVIKDSSYDELTIKDMTAL